MSGELFRPRRRPGLRMALAVSACIVLTFAAVVLVWMRVTIVPPDCDDPDTLALLRQALTGRFKLPPSVAVVDVRSVAGGYFAFRFACEAELRGIDPHDLPAGAPLPGSVYYVSRLTADHQRHQVSVRIFPVLKLERVQ
jgi:hypothetical protein